MSATGIAPCIEVRDLERSYRVWHRRERIRAVSGIDLTVNRAEIFGFLGPNGAGKTTTVKILLGLMRPDKGSVRILGMAPDNPALKRRTGYMPERMLLPTYLRLEEMLRMFGGLSGLRGAVLAEAVRRTIDTVGLSSVARNRLDTFSKGMLQRASLAQAILADPEVLFLDEPVHGLDPVGRREFRELLRRLRAQGKTVFLNSHELEVVEQVCDRVAILNKGKVLATAPISTLRDSQRYWIAADGDFGDPAALAENIGAAVTLAEDPRRLVLESGGVAAANRAIDALRQRGLVISGLGPCARSLEDLFMESIAKTGEVTRNGGL
ncbi:MAG: ABC transporter ATP-binding protein [Candidatus Schekmanbacteria bacterium]|nr:ABC transporter ATP-binding protein [Candidatus Schekmanbacteria bacterium]